MKLSPQVLCSCLLRRLVVLMLVTLVLFGGKSADALAQAKNSPAGKSVVESDLLKSFGLTVEAVTSFTPYYLTGDFNGDTVADMLIVVRLKARRSELPKDVTVLNPFYKNQGPAYPADPKKEPTLALVIFHGSNPKLPNSPAQKFLLVGPSPVLILENDRAQAEPDASGREGDRRRADGEAPTEDRTGEAVDEIGTKENIGRTAPNS